MTKNKLTNTDGFSKLQSLTGLNLTYNKINNLSGLGNIKSLRALTLFNNEITDISPLANLPNLTSLEIKNNPIKDFRPLSGIYKNLTSYDFTFNKIYGYISTNIEYNQGTENPTLKDFVIELEEAGIKVVTDSNGYFEINDVPIYKDGYTLTISKPNYLKRILKGINGSANVSISTKKTPIQILAGDLQINGKQDNIINITDIIEIAKAFNSISGNERYNTNYDFNLDNAINIIDVMIIAKSFNMTSDDYPQLESYGVN